MIEDRAASITKIAMLANNAHCINTIAEMPTTIVAHPGMAN